MDVYECVVIVGCGLAFGLLALFSLVWLLCSVLLIILVDVPFLLIKVLYQALVIARLKQQVRIRQMMKEVQEDE